jgi:hypothetical protein
MFTLAAFRNVASPALRAWIDAHALDVLHAAAPANVGFMDPKLLDVAEKIRRGVSTGGGAKALSRIADANGIEANVTTEDVAVTAYEGRPTAIMDVSELDDYARRLRFRDAPVLQRLTDYKGTPGVQLDVTNARATLPVIVATVPGNVRVVYTARPDGTLDLLRARVTDYDLGRTAEPTAKDVAGARIGALSTPEARALVAAWINKVTPDEERARKARTKREVALRDKDVGSCPVCFRVIGLKARPTLTGGGVITAHGYAMSGYRGYGHSGMYRASAECAGTGFPPWEASPRGAASYAEVLRIDAGVADTTAAQREAREIRTPFRAVQTPRGRLRTLVLGDLPRDGETVISIPFGDPRWDALNDEQAALARAAAKAMREEAPRYERIVAGWPMPADEAARIVGVA